MAAPPKPWPSILSIPTIQSFLPAAAASSAPTTWLGLGIFGSHDGGLTWPDRGGPPNGAALDIAFSPSWQSDGYAAVAFFQDVWSTGDRGATWQQLPGSDGGGPTYLQTVAVSSPTNGMHTLLAAGLYGGIHRSPDNGTTWHYDATPGTVRRVRFSPTAAGLALAAGSGIWRSTDGGVTWSQVFPARPGAGRGLYRRWRSRLRHHRRPGVAQP